MSHHDIRAGERWAHELAAALQETRFGIICLTKGNMTAPWVLFESGALSKTVDDAFVCPYLIGIIQSDIPAGPLTQFQSKQADKDGTYELVKTINLRLEKPLAESQLQQTFELWWPQLEEVLIGLSDDVEEKATARRDTPEMMEELLSIARELSRQSSADSEALEIVKSQNAVLLRDAGYSDRNAAPKAENRYQVFVDGQNWPKDKVDLIVRTVREALPGCIVSFENDILQIDHKMSLTRSNIKSLNEFIEKIVREGREAALTRTSWSNWSGMVLGAFDDILIPATLSLPPDRLAALEPWDLAELKSYDPAFLSGFRAQRYQVDLDESFEQAKKVVAPVIQRDVRHDIGGDEQRIDSLDTSYYETTFKHLLLPVYAGTYRCKGKPYQILVNGRTGEIQGERPFSFWKIALLVVLVAIVVAILVMVLADR